MGAGKESHGHNSYKTKRHDKEDDIDRHKRPRHTEKTEPNEITDEEILAMGLPLSFESSKGKQVQKNPVEAHRIGQIRKYNRVLARKLSQAMLDRLKMERLQNKLADNGE
ncbi:hypothetical protein TVAG_261080 [Trichomonas vaginalis G3]|uniref:Uncharacterized protein n=1 Tax=Trichomonas vaginalis (strain ATCC PRA-98 / G3) TaxID=412133 RepID=A2FPR8_TRIV3|nr:hypothetical protein TVAGG3_0494500 [Trichomonas vaginalis G3]EAX93098.1 hypothetical protein TVAG_261080 [Trichomonas vaginalis G3]KAI5516615.1 hypothetical protein TVAGG3_0494500 [Trichomonas vaginalis G3]|eukprot:XP_001306028.1 hypothetical protein [Trichomonas vaginalis G3]